jgi:hypothetical protein
VRRLWFVFIAVSAMMLTGIGTAFAAPTYSVGMTWQWVLQGNVDTTVNAQLFDIDGFDNTAATVASIHAKGAKAVCYISAGTFENWRPDAALFPTSVEGRSNGWPGEKWLDIRNLSVLQPIMTARVAMCKSKGFDAVEFDNVDGYTNSTGFPLTSTQQITYNTMLANAARAAGLGAFLKNDTDQATTLQPLFDAVISEQAYQYGDDYSIFPANGKAWFDTEYRTKTTGTCSWATTNHVSLIFKALALTNVRSTC